MATKQPNDIAITSLTGGFDDTTPAIMLPSDACVAAENVEFFYSSLGERRAGCAAMSLTGSSLDDTDAIVHLSQRFPTNDPNIGELWAAGVITDTSVKFAYRSNEDEWFSVTPVDAATPTAPFVYQMYAQPYQNKHFFAYMTSDDSLDRLHVWDGTTLRRTGLAEPAAPTGANEGVGTYATIRYFRVRYIEKSGSTILRRSEPSDNLAFTPSGTGAGVTITMPALINEGETHWELEASADGFVFYILATLTVATATYDDTTASPLSYAAGVLSEDIGEYLLQPSCKYLLVDSDHLIMAGHFTDVTKQSQVSWTPISSDPGVGNDERLPLNSLEDTGNNRVDLDNYEGGGITGVSETVNGSFYIFKWSHIYQATRTGTSGANGAAYDIICISKVRGALPGSVVSGMDEYGHGCIYFLDPLTGPSRLGSSGLQAINGIRRTWTRINRLATGVVSHGVYYPEKRQMHWWVSVDSANFPNLKLVLQVNETREDQQANVIRGWSLADGLIATAYCSAIINVEVLDAQGDIATISRRPYIGLPSPNLLQQCDLRSTDDGEEYTARIVTRPYVVTGLLNKWGTMTAALLAEASTTAALTISCIRDFGKETNSVDTDLAPEADETMVLKKFDDLVMSESYAIQFEFSDQT